MATRITGQGDFIFSYCEDLSVLPEEAKPHEVNLHGGFAVDRLGEGYLYYGMPGCGLMRIRPDLTSQEVIELPSDLKPVNFHSTKIVAFDGKRRIILPANDDEKVVIIGLDGAVDYVLGRPEFEEYADPDTPFRPTDAAAIGSRLYVADGYGANYISTADLATAKWGRTFAGITDDADEQGKFGTAHGLNVVPGGHHHHHLSIADRPHARFQIFTPGGDFEEVYKLPDGSRPCGIDFHEVDGHPYGLVGSLDDPTPGRPAPIYILEADTYRVVSTLRPKEDLGLNLVDHIHNTIWYEHDGRLFLVCQAWRLGMPTSKVGRLGVNVGIDAVLGAVPLVGDLFDMAWKANRRNVALLLDHLEAERRSRADARPPSSMAVMPS